MKFDRSSTFFFVLSVICILVINDANATLNRCVSADKRIEFTDQPCPSDTPSRVKRQTKVDSTAPTKMNLQSDLPPALHVIGISEGKAPEGVDDRPSWDRCNGNSKYKKLSPSAAPVPVASAAIVPTPTSSKCLIEVEKSVVVNITDNTRPIVLALMAYEKNHWKINLGKNVKIKKLILAGYHSQRASGLSIDTPVEIYTYDPSPCERCFKGSSHFHSDESPPAQLKEITGLDPSSFQGGAKGASFDIFPGMHIEKRISKENNWEIKAIKEVPKSAAPPVVVEPQLALDEAVRKGVIRKATWEDVEAFRDAYIEKKYASKSLPVPTNENALSVTKVDISRAYVVLKKFAYPSGMINEHRVVFFTPKGVSEPSGEIGHSATYDFETLTVMCTGGRTGGISC